MLAQLSIFFQGLPKDNEEKCLTQKRVNRLMKSVPGVEAISHDSLFLITRSTVFFVFHIIQTLYQNCQIKTKYKSKLYRLSKYSFRFYLQELFIMYMAKLASRNGGEDTSVTDDDLRAVIQRKKCLKFLLKKVCHSTILLQFDLLFFL